MNFFDLLFGGGRAIQVIFELGYIPDESDFKELTSEQYMSYYRKTNELHKENLYALIPDDHRLAGLQQSKELLVFSESEKEDIMKGKAIIENLLSKSDKTFDNDDERLRYLAETLPDVFSEGTKYGSAKIIEMTPMPS